MKVELSIKDDKELRNLIKDMIRGQVVNIARESLNTLIAETVERKMKNDSSAVSNIIANAVLKYDLREDFKKEMERFFKDKADFMLYQQIEKVFDDKSLTERVTKIIRRRFKFSVGVDDK